MHSLHCGVVCCGFYIFPQYKSLANNFRSFVRALLGAHGHLHKLRTIRERVLYYISNILNRY